MGKDGLNNQLYIVQARQGNRSRKSKQASVNL
jgi:hypothetical protein